MKHAVVLFLIGWSTLHAAIIWDTGPPNSNSYNIVDSRLAASFALVAPAAVTGIAFWYQAQFETDLSTVAYAVYANNAGLPGSLQGSGTASPSTSFDNANSAFYASFAISSLNLSPGLYWLELHSGTSLTDTAGFTLWWAASDLVPPSSALTDPAIGLPSTPIALPGYNQFAFQLSGTGGGGGSAETPEPSTPVLVLLALTLLRLLRRQLLSGKGAA